MGVSQAIPLSAFFKADPAIADSGKGVAFLCSALTDYLKWVDKPRSVPDSCALDGFGSTALT